jgi:type I restriction enzyme R subunit
MLKKSDVYTEFFSAFLAIANDVAKQNDPENDLDLESSIAKHIEANPKPTADTKAKTAQYFTILNRIEYVIALEEKYSESNFLNFLRLFNKIYNQLHRTDDVKDAIEVYFDNQIGIIEVQTQTQEPKSPKSPKIAEGKPPFTVHQFNILAILEARNEQEELKGDRIKEFAAKIAEFFAYVQNCEDGIRLVAKINSNVSEEEIYEIFSRIYRRYKILNQKTVGNYFFKEMEDLVNKLCDDFAETVRNVI